MLIIKESDTNALELACKSLRSGKIISFTADTVYGLAVDASNSKAVDALFALKKRDPKKPIAIFVKDLASAKKIFSFDEVAEKFAEKFGSKSLTLILETKPEISALLAPNLNQNDGKFLGFRIVNRDFIKNLLEKFGGILAVTSANPSNEKAAITALEVEKYFTKSNLDLLVDGGKSEREIASAVIKIVSGKIQIIRPLAQ